MALIFPLLNIFSWLKSKRQLHVTYVDDIMHNYKWTFANFLKALSLFGKICEPATFMLFSE